ncbi:MAG: phosphatidate cytidylyltransferase [Rhodobacteraceae bacterium]|nr:MAG: phosphatidate cytidylyltransferase [Paracoccaceae bacterium]
MSGAPESADAAARAARRRELRVRAISGVAMAALSAVPLWLGGSAAAAFLALVAAAAGWEWRRLTAPGVRDAPVFAGLFAAGVVVSHVAGVLAAAVVLAAAGAAAAAYDARAGREARWGPLGLMTMGFAAAVFLALRADPGFGLMVVVWIAVVVVATDVGAFFAGRLIGGPKLWPAVSPKKTWAGLGGGVSLAFLCGSLFSWATTGTYFQQVGAVSAAAALVAQGGDLAESAIKRRFGVKDSSGLIPGHGGVLDRLDGFCAATLVAGLVTFARAQPVFIW